MADKKRTQRDFYNDIIALAKANNRADLVEFAEGRIAVLDKKTGKVSAKKTAEVDANTALVYDALVEVGKAVTVSELIKSANNEVAEWSTPKATAYIKKLVDSGKVIRTVDKKTARFTVA